MNDERLCAEGLTVLLGGRAVLQDLDLALARGEVAAVVGPNGAGKSTLIQALAGLRRPNAGRVLLDGRPLKDLSDTARARRIGYLPQSPEIAWRLDVRTFVRLGRTAHRGVFGESAADARAVDQALAAAAMTDFAERDVTSLSGGERARALIARVLAGEPDWLLADEPLTGLDLFRQIAAAGAGVVVSLHDLTFAARIADRVVLLAEGRILADGPPDRALAADNLAQAWGVEARWIAGETGPLLEILGRAPGHE